MYQENRFGLSIEAIASLQNGPNYCLWQCTREVKYHRLAFCAINRVDCQSRRVILSAIRASGRSACGTGDFDQELSHPELEPWEVPLWEFDTGLKKVRTLKIKNIRGIGIRGQILVLIFVVEVIRVDADVMYDAVKATLGIVTRGITDRERMRSGKICIWFNTRNQ
jgi:hypothetical protein